MTLHADGAQKVYYKASPTDREWSWIALCDEHSYRFAYRHPEAVGYGEEMPTCRLCEKATGMGGVRI